MPESTLPALVVGLAAFGVSLLTLFSGFGLGTLLMPVFALFFPVEIAVGATALVHAANSVFKAGLLARGAPRQVLMRFGLPAVAASFLGAFTLSRLAVQAPVASWTLAGRAAEITPIKLVMGCLILVFALLELVPILRSKQAPLRWLPLGGALSGFFGGLSGHQGALRAVFLTPLKLSPTEFASSQAVIALMVDIARLSVYGGAFLMLGASGGSALPWRLIVTAALCAFAGAFVGKKLLHKMTMDALHLLVGWLLAIVGAGLASGLI